MTPAEAATGAALDAAAPFFLSPSGLDSLLSRLAATSAVYAPARVGSALHYKRFTGYSSEMVLDGVRATQPIKSFFFSARQRLAYYFSGNGGNVGAGGATTIVGAKACDLHSLAVLDSVFAGGRFKDPSYQAKRHASLIISSDCSEPSMSCFCSVVGHKPYAESGFDLNLSPVSGGFQAEVGSEKGERLVRQNADLFTSPSEAAGTEREEARARTLEQVQMRNEAFVFDMPLHDIVKRNLESSVWAKLARRCVGCAACEMVCPTCHCFLIFDQAIAGRFEKHRVWDSCHQAGFARAAGGGNPRPQAADRFKSRFIHKFVFFPETEGFLGCTGCGRCVEACLAGIDLRETLQELAASRQESLVGQSLRTTASGR
jgi:ferredoxin